MTNRKTFYDYMLQLNNINIKTDLNFLLAIYTLKAYLQRNNNQILVKDLLSFAFNFSFFNNTPLIKTLRIFNILITHNLVSRTKLFLRGFLNAIKLYSRFNYCLIPKHINSRSHYIVLQRQKII